MHIIDINIAGRDSILIGNSIGEDEFGFLQCLISCSEVVEEAIDILNVLLDSIYISSTYIYVNSKHKYKLNVSPTT